MAKRRKPQPARRMYEGARINRLTSDWVTSSTSADAEINSSLVRLRDRARQLCRDNPYARQALRAIAANVIGSGVRMQSQVPMQRGGGRLDQATNDLIEATWAEWCRPATCHVGGQLSWDELTRLAVTSMAESGEVFIRLVPEAFGGGLTPLGLEVIEADLLDEGKSSGPDRSGAEWRMGVHVDGWGRPIEYAFRQGHPGDLNSTQSRLVLIPADQIIHLRMVDRPGQTRGVSWFAAAVKSLHPLGGYQAAEVIRARATASLMGFVTSPEGELYGDDVVEGERVSNFEPGVFKYLDPGQNVTVPDLGSPNTSFEPFMRAMLRSVSASIGVSYETISRDFSQSNYSSSRLSLLEDRENWRLIQSYIIEHLHRVVYERWLDAATAVGALSLPNYQQLRSRYQAVRWFPRGWGWVDPEKEVRAYMAAERCGYMTKSQIVGETGNDLADVLRQLAEEKAMADELSLVFDTDPAKVSAAGLTQAKPAGSILPEPVNSMAPEAQPVANDSAAA